MGDLLDPQPLARLGETEATNLESLNIARYKAMRRSREAVSSGSSTTHTYREDSPRSRSPETAPTGAALVRIAWAVAIAICVGFWYGVALLLLSHV